MNRETDVTLQEQHNRWRRHFSTLLNIPSAFDSRVIESIEQIPVHLDLATPPSVEELLEAISSLKNGKSARKSGIQPEIRKAMMSH